MTIAIDRFDHIVLNVKDVEVSAAWYAEVLGMQREDFASRTGTRVAMRFGRHKLNFRPVDTDAVAWFTGLVNAQNGYLDQAIANFRLQLFDDLLLNFDGFTWWFIER
jgi:catechol 2,3-dioxygenase-like lactoylglutathione lyase family enzyme